MPVVVLHVGVQDGAQVAPAGDQEPVGAFSACTAHPAFGERVHSWGLGWCLHDLDARIRQDGIERCRVLGVPVADQEPERPAGVVEVHDQIAGALGDPGSGGVAGDAQDVDVAGGDLDAEEDVQLLQQDGVDGEEVDREDARGLGA